MDRRVKKTQAAIRAAFEELLKEKGDVNSISIKEIVDRADISRSTFYTHYSDILELTDDISRNFADEISNIIIKNHKNSTGVSSYENAYREVLTYLYERKSLTKAIICDIRNGMIMNRITDTVRNNLGEYYKQSNKVHDPDLVRATITFWVGGVFAIIRDWAFYDFRYPVDTMAKNITRAISTTHVAFTKK